MKIWKIEHSNKTSEGAKIAVSISSNESRGLILKPGEFILCKEQITASLDSQSRRGFVVIEGFDNSYANLEVGIVYNKSILDKFKKIETPLQKENIATSLEPSTKDEEEDSENDESANFNKLEKAKKDASDYMNNNDK